MNTEIIKEKIIVDVGMGNNPRPDATIVIDKYLDNDTTSRGFKELKILPHQKFIQGDICNLPFKDKEVDFIYASHIIEHIDDVEKALKELMRVSKEGYIEVPNMYWEWFFGRVYHIWLITLEDDTLIFNRKPTNFKTHKFDGDKLFAECKEFNKMFKDNINAFYIRLHWKDIIKYRVIDNVY